MSEGSLFLDFLRKFAQLGLEYMVTGSVASTMYGEPRVTHDVDVVLKLLPGDVSRFAESFPLDRERLATWVEQLGLAAEWALAARE